MKNSTETFFHEGFGDIEDEVRFWYDLQNIIRPIDVYLDYFNFSISVVGVIANIFHLIVLGRKSMRALTVNTFMMGIAICEFVRMMCYVIMRIPKYYRKYQKFKFGRFW